MRLPSDKSKFISQWKYVEVARFVPSLDRVIRDKDGDDPIFYDIDNINEYRIKNHNSGLYTSVWHFNTTDLTSAIRLGSLYFDLDNEDMNLCYKKLKACIIIFLLIFQKNRYLFIILVKRVST